MSNFYLVNKVDVYAIIEPYSKMNVGSIVCVDGTYHLLGGTFAMNNLRLLLNVLFKTTDGLGQIQRHLLSS